MNKLGGLAISVVRVGVWAVVAVVLVWGVGGLWKKVVPRGSRTVGGVDFVTYDEQTDLKRLKVGGGGNYYVNDRSGKPLKGGHTFTVSAEGDAGAFAWKRNGGLLLSEGGVYGVGPGDGAVRITIVEPGTDAASKARLKAFFTQTIAGSMDGNHQKSLVKLICKTGRPVDPEMEAWLTGVCSSAGPEGVEAAVTLCVLSGYKNYQPMLAKLDGALSAKDGSSGPYQANRIKEVLLEPKGRSVDEYRAMVTEMMSKQGKPSRSAESLVGVLWRMDARVCNEFLMESMVSSTSDWRWEAGRLLAMRAAERAKTMLTWLGLVGNSPTEEDIRNSEVDHVQVLAAVRHMYLSNVTGARSRLELFPMDDPLLAWQVKRAVRSLKTPPMAEEGDVIYAVQKKDLELVKRLIAGGASAKITAMNGETALHVAVRNGDVEAVKVLLDAGCDVEARDGEGNTPLHDAAICCQVEIARELLDHGAKVDAANPRDITPGSGLSAKDGRTALHLAMMNYSQGKFVERQARGTYSGTRYQQEIDDVWVVKREDGLEMVKLLVERKANALAVGQNRRDTPLTLAMERGVPTAVELMIRQMPDPKAAANEQLENAINAKSDEAVRAMLKLGADPNKVAYGYQNKPYTMLGRALEIVALPCAQALIDAGAEPLKESNFYSVARQTSNAPYALAFIVKNGGDLRVLFKEPKNRQETIQHVLVPAVTAGVPEVVKALLDCGADPTLPLNRYQQSQMTVIEYAEGIFKDGAKRDGKTVDAETMALLREDVRKRSKGAAATQPADGP